jgi:GT2 family glycosyltransferase
MERMENRLRLVEGRVREIEADHDRVMRSAADGRAPFNTPQPVNGHDQLPGREPADAYGQVSAVAVIVPVHNAPADTERCLEALFENGGYARLIVIDDASDQAAAQMLDALERRREFVLLRNRENLGYTRSINIGVHAATGVDAVVVLNSDTVVTVGWLDRIKAAFNANPKAGIIGPWSNAATYQSLPRVKDEAGQFSINPLAEGFSPDDIALALADTSPKYPRVPVINGFCFAVRGSVFEAIGEFDEAAFPIGYGEENDFCMRAADAGFELVIADDAYVFHGKSKSFGAARRTELAKSGRLALNRKHGASRVKELVRTLDQSKSLAQARHIGAERIASAAPASLFSSLREAVAYVLPAKPGGGGVHSIIQEASFLAAHGVKATVFVPAAEMAAFRTFYGNGINQVLAPYRNVSHLVLELRPYAIVVATVYKSIPLVETMLRAKEKRVFYYVQDYEPFFHAEDTREHAQALATYETDPRCVLFAKTRWLQQMIRERHAREVRLVLPSLDHSVFFPGKGERKAKRIAAMVRPSTPRRSPAETVALAAALASRKRKGVNVSLFGCEADDPVFAPVRDLKGVERLGRLKREEVADLLRRSDIFVDLSTYQAFGRTSIEGMACGCVPIVPRKGGGMEFAVPEWNSFDADVSEPDFVADCIEKIDAIYDDIDAFRERAIETAARYSVARAATSIVKVFMQA